MLQALRERSKTWVGVLLAGFLIFLFAIWGAEGLFQVGFQQSDPVIEVGDATISGTEFERIYSRSIQTIERQTNDEIDYAEAKRSGLLDRIIEDVVEWTLIERAATANGLAVSDSVVRAEMRGREMFHTAGRFDQARFLQVLSLAGMNPQQYVDELRQEIARDYMISATSSARPEPSSYLDLLYAHRRESRAVHIAVISLDSVTDLPEPAMDQLRELYEANSDDFIAPEFRKVSLFTISQEELTSRIELSEAEIREYYQERREIEFTRAEQRIVDHILFSDRQTAQRAHEALQADGDFAEVAREIGNTAPIDLGSVQESDIPIDALRDAAFGMEEPGVSGPVQSIFGWHIVRVVNIAPMQSQPLEEVRGTIADRLRRRAAVRLLDETRLRLEDMLDAGRTLEEMAAEVGARIVTIDALDAEGRNPRGAALQNLPNDPDFMRLVFDFEEGETSDAHELGDDALYMMRVEEITPSRLRSFEEVRDQLRARWRGQTRERIARERAETLMSRVRAGQSLEEAAQAMGLAVSTSRLAARGRPPSPDGAGNALQAQAFAADEGDPFLATAEGGIAVGVVQNISEAEVDRDSEAYRQMVQSFRVELAGEVGQQFSNELRERFPVTVHMERIDQLLGFSQ